jgi:bifunctional UDP-N-acetylglucosamine pyrophosphorylase/glucosamine-1-phosphate N-acetyltransferase
MNNLNISAIVLAGGRGKRMNSDLAKVLHTIADRPMVVHTLEKLKKLDLDDVIVVVGHQAENVKETLGPNHYAHQAQPLGTGDAVRTGLSEVSEETKYILVVNGDDSAFYSVKTLQDFIENHIKSQAPISMITLNKPEAQIARVIRDEEGFLKEVIEWRDYPDSSEKSDEVNCGAYVFNAEFLRQNINKIPLSNTGEYYVTELLKMAREQGKKVNIFKLEDPNEWIGVNTQEELQKANELISKSGE